MAMIAAAGSVLDGPPQMARGRETAVSPTSGQQAGATRRRAPDLRCPECAVAFAPASYNQLFCRHACRKAFNNRNVTRGQSLTPLAMAARMTRDGSAGDKATGTYARQESRRLIALFAAEDKAAGRMSMVEYVALRRRVGILTKLDG